MRLGTVLAAIALVAVAGVTAAPAAATDATPRAKIVYAADNAIQTMNADGSRRSRLTRGQPFTGAVADSDPLWSRDGRRIVFQRWRVHLDQYGFLGVWERGRVWAMNRDGSGGGPLFGDPGPDADDYLVAMLPSGEFLVERVRYDGKHWTGSYVAVDADGSHRRPVADGGRFQHNDVAFSPTGEQLLFTDYHADKNYFWHPDLWVMNADGTGRRLLQKDGGYGRWSPDGRRIVFTSIRDHNGSSCDSDYCDWHGEIYTMGPKGGKLQRLTVNDADDQHPSWSADGSRIVFSSPRNSINDFSHEIYTIRPDGTCLTWLTNGSRTSEEPAWDPTVGETDPGACGAAGREPVMDLDLTYARRAGRLPVYWLGPVLPGKIVPAWITMAYEDAFGLSYFDCGYFDRQACGEGTGIDSTTTCGMYVYSHMEDLLNRSVARHLEVHDGVLVSDPGPGGGDPRIYAGPTTIEIAANGPRLLRLMKLLRRVGSAPAKLPRTGFQDAFWKELKRVEDSYARTHDEAKTAAELKLKKWQVHRRLALAKRLRELGVQGQIDCPRGV